VTVLERLDFLLSMRLRGKPATIGAVFLGVLVLSLLFFLLLGNGKTSRVLFFPGVTGRRLVAEERLIPRQPTREAEISQTAEEVLLGPARNDALRLFPRGARVISTFVEGRTIVMDLSPLVLLADPEVPLRGQEALAVLERSLRYNFPHLREVDFFIDGQPPRFP
jgi:hypothetical protein